MSDEVFRKLPPETSAANPYLKDSFPGPDNLYRLKTVVNEIYAQARRRPISFPTEALCLHAEVVTLGPAGNNIADFQLDSALGRTVKIIEVIAHVPRLDTLKTIPEVTTIEDMSHDDLWNLLLHASGDRIFRAQLYGEEGKAGSIPSPGDTISVDFKDRVGRKGPIYVGKKRRGIGLIPSVGSMDTTSTSDIFDTSGEPTVMAEYSTSEEEQLDEQQEIINDKLNEYAEAFAADTGVSIGVARGYLESTLGLSK
tara:strand:+ start:215 stop:976 length:762 start_codon:yes stop_codon:yes gene_type:complete